MSAELLVTMLEHVMKGRRRPLFLVLDSLAAHRARMVRDYVETTNGKLELHFLPGYAPELNPDELVWNYVKRTGTAKRPLPPRQEYVRELEPLDFEPGAASVVWSSFATRCSRFRTLAWFLCQRRGLRRPMSSGYGRLSG